MKDAYWHFAAYSGNLRSHGSGLETELQNWTTSPSGKMISLHKYHLFLDGSCKLYTKKSISDVDFVPT